MKTRLFWEHPWRYRTYVAAICGLPVWLIFMRPGKRGKYWIAAAACLSSMAVLMLVIGCLGDVLDSVRHLFLFNATLDILFLGCLGAMAIGGGRSRTPLVN